MNLGYLVKKGKNWESAHELIRTIKSAVFRNGLNHVFFKPRSQ
jgi:hypothetical protein